MASVSWTATTSGSWTMAGAWNNPTGPARGDDVTIAPTSAITVTYGTGTLLLNTLTTANSTLAVTGGTLAVQAGYSIGGPLSIGGGVLRLVGSNFGENFGALTQTGGTLVLVNDAFAQSQSQNATITQTGGTITLAHGALTDRESGGSFAGTINGGGEMIFDTSSATTLAAGFVLATGSAEIEAGTVYMNENLTYGKQFTVANAGTLELNGHTVALGGTASLDGDVRSGTLAASGGGQLNGLTLDNGALLSLAGTYNETGAITLGANGTGTLSIGTGSALRITGNDTIFNGSGGGTLVNAGLLVKAGGSSASGTAVIFSAVNNTGTIRVDSGVIDFRGPSSGYTSTLGGVLTGAGTVAFDSGSYLISAASSLTLAAARTLLAGSANVTLTTALSYAGSLDQTGGTLVVGSPGQSAGALTLTGTDAFDGGLLKGTGTVLTSGTVNLGAGMDLEGNLQFQFSGPVNQTGAINLGLLPDAITVATVAAGDSWLLRGNSSIFGMNGVINNHGTFAKLSGAGTSTVQSDLYNTANLIVSSGELVLSGVGSLGGTVSGAAALDISGAYQFAAGLSLTVGEVILDAPFQSNEIQATLGGDLTYAHNWAQEGGTLALGGHMLTLTGVASLAAGDIQGPGSVVASGPVILGQGFGLQQGAQLQVNGATEQAGNVVLSSGSSAPTLTIGGSSTYTMDAGVHLGGQNDNVVGTVTVAGTLAASGAGTTTVAATVVDNGMIKLSYGEMSFLGSISGNGGVTIANGGVLDLAATGTLAGGITFGAGGGLLDLGTPGAFTSTINNFASGDVIELGGFAFTTNQPVVLGNTVTITETSGPSITLHFNTAQTGSLLLLGEGPHGGLALIHL